MSMTQVAIFRKSELPKIEKIEKDIQSLGYDFEIRNKEDSILPGNGLECTINGHQTYFETYIDEPQEVISEFEFIKSDLTNEDISISFVWGADFAAGACIGLISIALIDNCDAKIYYLDDEMKYTREMLINDTPQFLRELSKTDKLKSDNSKLKIDETMKEVKKQNFWSKLKDKFKK